MKQLAALMRFLLGLSLRVIACILVGVLLLGAVYTIPADRIDENLKKSAPAFAEEGVYPRLTHLCFSQLDNFTDALMLMNAAHNGSESAFVQAMYVNRGFIEGLDPYEALVSHYTEDTPFDHDHPYSRYWHGYLLFLKPLLCLTTYQGIRIINAILQTALLGMLIYLMIKNNLKMYVLPYIISVLFLMPITLALSLQFSSCYYTLTLGSICVLICKDRLDQIESQLFLYIGVAVAFFDYLTYPIATLGIPALFYCLVRGKMTISQALQRGIKVCFSWGFGYGVMWVGKWAVGSLITGVNIFESALTKVAERSSINTGSDYGIFGSLYSNLVAFLQTPATILAFVLVIILLVRFLIQLRSSHPKLSDIAATIFPFLILAFLPIVWYVVTANHSTIHYWFTHKALVVSAFAGLSCLTALCQKTETT